jgi:hypothetical protein
MSAPACAGGRFVLHFSRFGLKLGTPKIPDFIRIYCERDLPCPVVITWGQLGGVDLARAVAAVAQGPDRVDGRRQHVVQILHRRQLEQRVVRLGRLRMRQFGLKLADTLSSSFCAYRYLQFGRV